MFNDSKPDTNLLDVLHKLRYFNTNRAILQFIVTLAVENVMPSTRRSAKAQIKPITIAAPDPPSVDTTSLFHLVCTNNN